jgi:hypothetical protein
MFEKINIYLTTITSRQEQHVCIKFYFKQGKNAMNTSKNLKLAFGELIMGIIQLLGWFSTFKSGMTSAKYVECSGHSSISTRDKDVPNG